MAAGNKDVKAVAPVWQQLAKSIISWQTALVVGITLLSVYGKEVINWGKELVKGKNYVLDLLSAEQELALARRKGIDASAKERVELDLLYTKLKSTSASQKERTAAANAWISRYPKYADVINGEKVNLDKLKLSYNALSKEIEQSAIARSYMDKVADIAVKKDKEDIKLKNQQVTLEKARQRLLKANEERDKALEAQQKGLYGSTNAVAKANDEIVAANKAFQEQKKIYNDISNNISKLDEQQATFINHINTISIFPQPKEGTYDYWQQQVEIADNALKQIQDSYLKVLKSGNTQGVPEEVAKQYNALIKQKTEAEEKLKIYDDKGLSKEYNSIVDQNQKISDLMDKQSIERKRREEDLENQVVQSRIDAMADGEAKIRAQRELDNKKEIQDLKRQREDYIRTEIEYQKKIFDERERLNSIHIKNYKKKTFDPSSVSVDTTEWDTIIGNTQQRQAVDWYKPLLKQYQTYADQRLAIEKQFNDDIALLRKAREKAEKSGDTTKVSQIDRSIAKAISEKGKALMQHDFDILKKSPEYVRAFENLKETSSETLNSLLTQLENAKQTAAQVLSPDQLREYTTTIQEIMDELDSRNPFQTLVDRQRELAEAEKELANAQRNLNKVNSGENVISGTKYNNKTGKIETIYLSATQALDNYNKAKDKAVKADSKVQAAEKRVSNVIDDLSNSIKNVGSSVGGQAGEIIGLIGDIGTFAMSAMSGIETASQTASAAVKAVESASVILMIISTAIQIATKISNMFSKDKEKEMERYVDQLNAMIDIYERIIEKQKESIKFGYGFSAITSAKKAMEELNNKTEQYRKIAQSAGSSKDSLSRDYMGRLDEMLNDVKPVSFEVKLSSLTSIDTSDFSKLTAKQLLYIRDNYKDIWSALNEEQRNALQAIIDAEEESKEIVDAWKESITGISYDNLYSEFIDTLSDMDSSAEDMANNFGEYLRKSILASMVANEFQDKIDNLYEMWVNAGDEKSEGGTNITEDEAKKIQERQKELAEAMTKRREEIEKTYGFDSSTSSQESTKKGFAAASQDSIDELNGRFTALQIAGEEIKNQSTEQTRLLDSINSILLNIDPSQASFNIPDLSLNREALNSSFAADIAMRAESNAQLQAAIVNLTGEVQAIKSNVGEMLAFSVENRLDQQTIAESSSALNKNLPKITQALDGIKQNTSGLSHR